MPSRLRGFEQHMFTSGLKHRIGTLLVLWTIGNLHAQQIPQRMGKATTVEDPAVVVIAIEGFQYNGGQPVAVKVGQRVVWVNRDNIQHTASGNGREFDTGILQPGATSEPVAFLHETGSVGIPYHCNVHDGMSGTLFVSGTVETGQPSGHHEMPSVHSMVVSGETTLLLNHIALFNDNNHSYQVILEAQLGDPGVREAYAQYRKAHPNEFCQLDPEYFLLPEIESGKRTSFGGTFKRNGDDSNVVPGLGDVQVNILRIVEFRRFAPDVHYPERLTYRLYGNANELFLTNRVTEAPNFQEVVKIRGIPGYLTPDMIASNPLVTIPSKRLSRGDAHSTKTAVLNNNTHLLLSPPAGTLNPVEPLTEGEEIEVQFEGEQTLRKLTIDRLIYFDVRILNK